jgi:hypothetical protein
LLAVEAEGTRVRLTRREDGESWTIANDGRELRFAPGGDYVAWDVASKSIAHPDVREHALWVAEVTGAGGRRLATTIGGGLVGWAHDGQALVAAGRIESDGQEGIWSIPLDGSAPLLIHQVLRPRDVLLSPAGGWVAFYAAFTGDAGQNGLWVVRIDGVRSPRSRSAPLAGRTLALIPLTGDSCLRSSRSIRLPGTPLGRPTRCCLAAANADWLVSPTGPRGLHVLGGPCRKVLTLPEG